MGVTGLIKLPPWAKGDKYSLKLLGDYSSWIIDLCTCTS